MGTRQCPFCGWIVDNEATFCHHCREAIPEQSGGRVRDPAAGRGQIRRGLLYMILAAVIHYLAGGLGDSPLPFEVPSIITEYATPFLFLGGLGLFLYGGILKLRG